MFYKDTKKQIYFDKLIAFLKLSFKAEIAVVKDVLIMNIKIISVILLTSGIIFFDGCGYEKVPEKKPASQNTLTQETRPSENKPSAKIQSERDETLNRNIEVTKDEMDRFISVAKNYKLTENEVRRLVQIFKQIGMNFDNRLRIEIEPIQSQKITWAMGPIEYTTKGYTMNCQYIGTKPQIVINDISRNAKGYYIFTYRPADSDSINDFEIYFEFLFGEAICPMYKNHRIVETVKTLSCTVTDEAFNKMYDTITREVSSKGKFIEIQKFYGQRLSRELRPEDYEVILNEMDNPKELDEKLGIKMLKNVTRTGITVLKDTAELSYAHNAPYIMVFPDIIIESNVYGEGKKQFYGYFEFRPDGTLIKYNLWESNDKIN